MESFGVAVSLAVVVGVVLVFICERAFVLLSGIAGILICWGHLLTRRYVQHEHNAEVGVGSNRHGRAPGGAGNLCSNGHKLFDRSDTLTVGELAAGASRVCYSMQMLDFSISKFWRRRSKRKTLKLIFFVLTQCHTASLSMD